MKVRRLLVKRITVEIIGTFFITLVFGLGSTAIFRSYAYDNLFLPLWMGVALALFYYLFSEVSGAHFNPMVTLSLYVMQIKPVVETLAFLVAQVGAAFLGIAASRYFLGSSLTGLNYTDLRAGFYLEALGAFLLCFTYMAVEKGRLEKSLAGLIIGACYGLAITMVTAISGGVINPAIALAIDGNAMVYIVSPLAGGLVGAAAAGWLYKKED